MKAEPIDTKPYIGTNKYYIDIIKGIAFIFTTIFFLTKNRPNCINKAPGVI